MKIAIVEEVRKIVSSVLNFYEEIELDYDLVQNGYLTQDKLYILIKKYENKYNCNMLGTSIKDLSTIRKSVNYINKLLEIDNYSVRDLFNYICNRNLDKIVFDFDDVSITYKELRNNVKKISQNLLKMNISKNDRVVIILPNCIEYIYIYFALFQIGALPVPISTVWKLPEIMNVCMNSKPSAVVYKKKIGILNYDDIVEKLFKNVDSIKIAFYLNDNEFTKNSNVCREYMCFDKLLMEINKHYIEDLIFPEDVAIISYTSGTTGEPKGVMLNNMSIVHKALCTSNILTESYKEQCFPLIIAPMFSAQGFIGLFSCLINESISSVTASINPNYILKKIGQKKINMIQAQPTMLAMMLSSKAIENANLDYVKVIAVTGACCSHELAKRIETIFKCKLINIYGMSETTCTVSMTRYGDSDKIRYCSIGRTIPGVEIKIVDNYRNRVVENDIGELAVRGYNMVGYYKDSQRTRQIMDESGWIYTGDLARYIDKYNFEVIGRKKDMIIRGGFNIYPSDIENELIKNDKIMCAAVVGKKHKIVGEQIVAFIVLKPRKTASENEIIRYLIGKIASNQVPDKVYFIKEMPLVLSGKVDKKVLKRYVEDNYK